MVKNLLKSHFTKCLVAGSLVIALGVTLEHTYGHSNSAIKNDSNKEVVGDKQNIKNDIPTDMKADYIGDWEDLYSQRAGLSIEDIGNNQLKAEIGWSNSAVSSTNWTFICSYQDNTGNLDCTNGKQIDTYIMCKGKRINNTGEADECANSGGDVNEVNEIVKQNMTAAIILTKGNLKQAMDDVGFFGDRDDVLKNSKNMTLYVKNISDEDSRASLENCAFYKYNNDN